MTVHLTIMCKIFDNSVTNQIFLSKVAFILLVLAYTNANYEQYGEFI